MERKREAESLQTEDKKIELLLQETFDYSDEQLLKELEMAEAEVRSAGKEDKKALSEGQEPEGKVMVSEGSGEADSYAPVGEFETILAKMEERGIQLQLERELADPKPPAFAEPDTNLHAAETSELERPPERTCLRPARIAWKALFVAVIAGCLLLGMGLPVGGRKALRYEADVRSGENSNIAWNNEENNYIEVDSEEEAYRVIEEELGIPVLKLGFRPEGMRFIDVTIEKNFAIMRYMFNENYVYFKQFVGLDTISEGIRSDRIKFAEVRNNWLERDIIVEKEEGKDGFSAMIETNKTYYYFEGVVNETDFLNMVEDIRF